MGRKAVIEIGKEKQRNWKAKLMQMSEDRLVKRVYIEEARGKRPRGRPRKNRRTIFNRLLNIDVSNRFRSCITA